ncbi:MAG TPA: glycosyltransferase [Fibrobacteria bacterium]|nr:glycosyltransferase [Fibrobacteria bacterium]
MPQTLRVLSNLPLPVELHVVRTFGDYLPAGTASAWTAGKERRGLADILPLIPASEKPDVLVISSPEYLPIPCDVASFPGTRILLITDWNMCLRFLPDLCALFDFCFVDWPGYRLLRAAGIANVHHQPLFGHDPAAFFLRDGPFQGGDRNLEVSFCGNLNAGMHRERNRLLARLCKWGARRPFRVHLGQAFGAAYADILGRSRLVFNYSIRGEANMRLYEAMACGAVPLVEAGNLEVPRLFQPDRHYFGYEPDRLEERLESLLADPERIEAAAAEASAAVASHTKAKQIRSLLDFAGRESALRPGPGAGSATGPGAPGAVKALVKMRVLGAAYTMGEALGELEARGAALPGLIAETLPASLLTLLESNPRETLAAAEAMLERMLLPGGLPEPIRTLFRTRLHALRAQWAETLEWSGLCLQALDALEAEADAGPLPDLYAHFYPPIGLGKGIATDLNRAFREDLETGSRRGYLGLMRAHCRADRARALLALDRPAEALDCAGRIPRDRFVSLEPYLLLYQGLRRIGDTGRLRAVLRDWFAETPLDWTMWDKAVEGLGEAGADAELIAFLEEILILSRYFLTPDQVGKVRALLEGRRGTPASPRERG